MKTAELLWRHRYMSCFLLWRHIYLSFWCCCYRHFRQNGVANQGRFSMTVHRRCIYRNIFFRFRGRIEIDHSYGLCCRGLCCCSGTAHVGQQRSAPLMLCRSSSTNHSSTEHTVANSYNFTFSGKLYCPLNPWNTSNFWDPTKPDIVEGNGLSHYTLACRTLSKYLD